MTTNNQDVGQIERATQNRVVSLFRDRLNYEYLGNWEDRLNNSNIEESEVRKYLSGRGYSEILIERALNKLVTTANNYSESLYTNNKNVYKWLRYGVGVIENIGENNKQVHFIDWANPEKNNFAIAEEVTFQGNREKRPDIVLYVNGIAIGVLELKRSTVSIGDGIRQSIVNQQKEFIESFFSTIQIIFAGNDTEGLRYGTIGTPEKFFLQWKEDEQDDSMLQIDKYLLKLCDKKRLLEILYDFVLFDGGTKKLPRTHQYLGIKAAQDFVRRREGGIVWHTQGSGKSLFMVWLAKWILENNPKSRIVILTDRIELDKQIKRVFEDAGETIERATSGKDLMERLNNPLPRLLCSLIHKFGARDVGNFDAYIKELESAPSNTVGELYVFVDECHRSESGKMHKAMKAILKNSVFIGFTGTPLLKKDKQTSQQVFGRYIHTYKFNEAVKDGVVLDLMYEARDIDTKLSSSEKVDAWFEAKTRGLNGFQKHALKEKWGTMRKVLSSRPRMEKIVQDIIFDFSTKPRLNSEFGNAILVAGSIYEATRYFEMFQDTPLRGKCALITSYNPTTKDISKEGTGENTDTEKEYVYKIYTGLLKDIIAESDKTKSETYEDKMKKKFIEEPANMKLLIVVDKLLVGFDSPPCTFLYIDKRMQDHGLFQAICRVNRLDSEDKEFGYIVDYKDLFQKLEGAYCVYASELDKPEDMGKKDIDIVLQNRLTKGKERLDNALEAIALVCEPVAPPRDNLAYIHYFCGNPENKQDLKDSEMKRTALYKHTVGLIRAYANIAEEMTEAGYSAEETEVIKNKLNKYLKLREEIRMSSGEKLDLKAYEADMRHLIDTYIQAEDARRIDPFGDQSLLDIMLNSGIAEAIKNLPAGIRSSKEAVAETIENNVRRKIIKDHLIDPAYFDEMSKLLSEIVRERKANAISYEEYLKKIAELAARVTNQTRDDLPAEISTNAQRALYRNLGNNQELAIAVDAAVHASRHADWRGNIPAENLIKQAIYGVIKDKAEVERIFSIIKQQNEY